MLPFTHAQFLDVFAAYNAAVWPAPVLAYALGAAVCLAIARSAVVAAWLAPCALAAMWTWTGATYHWLFFARVNEAAIAFGAAFVLQGMLFALAAIRRRMPFGGSARPSFRLVGWGLVGYAALLYPALGAWAGLHSPAAPVFGTTPCPLTIFSFGVLLLADRAPWWLLPIPLAWSLIGGSAAWQLAIPQDWMLPVSGAAALAMLWRARKPAAAA